MPDTPIHVTAGFGWTAAGAWATAISVVAGLLTLVIKQIGPWRKQTTDAEAKLREEMSVRVDSLEKQVDALRAELLASHDRCEKIISEMRSQHALEMQSLRERHLLDLANALTRRIEEERHV